MEEQFVSYEMALKLKEKGFNERCFGLWETWANSKWNAYPDYGGVVELYCKYYSHRLLFTNFPFDKRYDNVILAPTHQQVIDWLDSLNINILLTYSSDVWGYQIPYRVSSTWDNSWLERKDALNAAIEEAIKFI